MNKSAKWSPICYLLALISCIIGCFLLKSDPQRAVGCSILGLYFLLLQIIWSILASRPPGHKLNPGDIACLVMCALGTSCVFTMIIWTFGEMTRFWLMVGSLLFVLFSIPVAAICDTIARPRLSPRRNDH